MTQLFNADISKHYDDRNRRLAPIADNLHFLMRLILRDLPADARVLCVGVGTGAEILALAHAYPAWSFTGVDPSGDMLAVCRERLEAAGIMERCILIEGYVSDVPSDAPFDACLSILVGHFVPRDVRGEFYRQMVLRLKNGGYLVNAEISCDMDSAQFPSLLTHWGAVQTPGGQDEKTLAALENAMRGHLHILPPREIEALIRRAGIAQAVPFFQALAIGGWYGVKAL